MRTWFGLAWVLVWVLGCDSVDGGSAEGGDSPSSCNGSSRCLDNLCVDAGSEFVEWSDQLELGTSAEQAFAALEGSCEAPFSWNGEGSEPNTVDPPSGETTITVTVALDRSSARRMQYTPTEPRRGRCEAMLSVDAHVRVQTADGVFDDEADVTLTYGDVTGRSTFGFVVPLQDLGGALAVTLGEGERGSLHYHLSGADDACAGEVMLAIDSSHGGTGSSSSGRLASWSASGCAVGESRVDPSEPDPEQSIADAIAAAWGEASYPGEWDDGVPAELELTVEVADGVACRESSGVVAVPVRATYGTGDGRIESHGVDAHVNAGGGDTLELWIDDTMACASRSDALPYTLRGCDELESVVIQLGVHTSGDGGVSFSDSGLNAYESLRDGDAPPGAADNLRRLLLGDDR